MPYVVRRGIPSVPYESWCVALGPLVVPYCTQSTVPNKSVACAHIVVGASGEAGSLQGQGQGLTSHTVVTPAPSIPYPESGPSSLCVLGSVSLRASVSIVLGPLACGGRYREWRVCARANNSQSVRQVPCHWHLDTGELKAAAPASLERPILAFAHNTQSKENLRCSPSRPSASHTRCPRLASARPRAPRRCA